jgi:hypothetical protein
MSPDPAHDRRRLTGDEGAVLVEFALFAPVLMLLAMGLLEFGIIWRDKSTVHTATRAGARAGSNSFVGGGQHQDADFNTLLAVKAGLAQIPADDIVRVVIYSASSSDGAPSEACATHDPGNGLYGSPGGQCNVYTGEFIDTMSTAWSDWNEGYDNGWEPDARDTYEFGGYSYVGVYIELDHPYVTGIFPGGSIDIIDREVMALEPCGSGIEGSDADNDCEVGP